jgi:hypothetical protein
VCGHRVDRVFRTHLYSSVLSVPLLLGPVIAMPSVGRSVGISPGRRDRGSPPAKRISHRAQAQGSRERLLGLVAVSCGAFWQPPRFDHLYSSRSWQECTMTVLEDTAPVTSNGWGSACLTFCNVRQILSNCLKCRRGDGVVAAVRLSPAGSGLAGFGSSGRWAKPRGVAGPLTKVLVRWPLQLFSII